MTIFLTLKQCLALLEKKDRFKLIRFGAVQLMTSLLDLAGILLLSGLTVFGSLALNKDSSTDSRSLTNRVFTSLNEHFSSQSTFLTFLLVASVLLFSTKSIISLLLFRRMYTFLSQASASYSARLARALFKQDLLFLQKRSSQETAAAVSYVVTYAIVDTLGAGIILISEYALLGLLGMSLLIVDPVITLFSLAYFAFVIYLLQVRLLSLAAEAGETKTKADIKGIETIQEVISLFRELTISDRRSHFISEFEAIRRRAAKASMDSQWVGLVPKYSLETALVIGGGLLGISQFLTKDPAAAIGTLTLFLAAGSRVLPSLLRIQSAVTTVKYAGASADITFKLVNETEIMEDLTKTEIDKSQITEQANPSKFIASIEVSSVTFTYPGQTNPALSDISISVRPGEILAVVGSSGAGKSTLTDIILGVISPDLGRIMVGGESPVDTVLEWPGKIAYVPQQTALTNKTIRENVAIGRSTNEIDDDRVWECLAFAQLSDFVKGLEDQLDSLIGEQGQRLSGGQRQRLGIARAIYTGPEILVLDEATSAMDSETEHAISEALARLAGRTTLIIIAHRLSTVRKANQVLYLKEGRALATGSFEELRKTVPDFDRQASLLGL
jgi:ABC-type multidrug transport system fused ATPase/permease subunit